MATEPNQIVWDFGFLDESEIDGVQQAYDHAKAAEGSVQDLQNRLDKLYKAIQPLLGNLKKDPHKDYILFPDRGPKIEAFEAILAKIYYGKN